jgi:hypothetical protein
MDIAQILAHLREELDSLNIAIATLERLRQPGRRRGRPPALLQGLAKPTLRLTGGQAARTERRRP